MTVWYWQKQQCTCGSRVDGAFVHAEFCINKQCIPLLIVVMVSLQIVWKLFSTYLFTSQPGATFVILQPATLQEEWMILEVLKNYKTSTVANIDSTYSLNNLNFALTLCGRVNKSNQYVPCSYLVSSDVVEGTLIIYLTQVILLKPIIPLKFHSPFYISFTTLNSIKCTASTLSYSIHISNPLRGNMSSILQRGGWWVRYSWKRIHHLTFMGKQALHSLYRLCVQQSQRYKSRI